MSSTTRVAATLDELARVEGKAELIAGEIVHLMATGRKPNRIAFRMARSLDDHAQTTRAVFFWMERSRKMGLALARDERCLSHFSGLIPTIRSNENRSNLGEVYTDNVGFAVPMLPSGRQSFSPDASYFLGPFPVNEMRFLEGAPTFAVEVRSENDYTDAAELAMAAKRADYFAAGTLVVWDVDPLQSLVRKYRWDLPDAPVILTSGQEADAELAVSGWRMAVDQIFG